MAGYFKKRRDHGPSKNEQKVMRARSAENQARTAETLADKFPSVRSLRVHLTFLDARQAVLDEKDMTISPEDTAVFSASCPGRCGSGTFDFSAKVAAAVAGVVPASEASAKCPVPLYADSKDTCGCELRCKIELEYFPAETSS